MRRREDGRQTGRPWGLPRSGAIPDSILHRSKHQRGEWRRIKTTSPPQMAGTAAAPRAEPTPDGQGGGRRASGRSHSEDRATLLDQEFPSHHPKAGRMTLPQPLPTKTQLLSTHGGKEALSKPVLAIVSRSPQNTPCGVQAGGTCGWQGPTATMASWGGQSLPAPCREDSSS